MIPSIEAARAINFHRKEAIVVSTSSALRDWNAVSDRRELDVDLTDCMDRAPGVGLGLSLAQPDKQVLVLDCDATIRTDLAAFATIGKGKEAEKRKDWRKMEESQRKKKKRKMHEKTHKKNNRKGKRK